MMFRGRKSDGCRSAGRCDARPEPGAEERRRPQAMIFSIVRGVSKQFGGTQALNDVGMHLNAGEILALLGENGAGKSTLIKILAGVHALDDGQRELSRAPTSRPRSGDCPLPSSIRISD